jgi:hypothetical protein
LKKYLWDEGRSSAEAAVIILPNGKSIHEAYQRRVDFVDELVDPADEYAAYPCSASLSLLTASFCIVGRTWL